MESLGDDVLLYIFDKIHHYRDKISFCQVSKQFLKLACTRLRWLDVFSPRLLKDIIHACPSMLIFKCYKPLSNSCMELLSRSCPNLRFLRLTSDKEGDFQFDFDDDGLCLVAKACSLLGYANLDGRLHVGDIGVDCLVRSCKDLRALNLSRCEKVTDESLKSIRESNSLQKLYLDGCLISDMGLEYMAKGDLKNNLMLLYLNGCDKISDTGICHLKQMVNLTRLSLSKCGVNITDCGISALSQIPNIEVLNLSWLINVTDIALSQIATNCRKLKFIILTGCEAITGKGVRYFAHHPTLEHLDMSSCYNNIFWDDVELIASTCRSLISLCLSRRIMTPVPTKRSQKLSFQGRRLEIWWFS